MQTPAQTGGRPASPQHLPCMALYCIGVMCSKPGGGTSQYLRTFFFFSWRGERISPPCSSLAPLVKGLLRRRLSREALRWSRLRRSRLRLRRFRSRLRERLWLRFRCRFSLSRSCLFSLSCRSNSSKSDMLRRPRRPCAALASPCRPPAPDASATSAARFGYFRASPARLCLLTNQARPACPAPAPPLSPPARKIPLPPSLFPKRVVYIRTVEKRAGRGSVGCLRNTRSEGSPGFPGCRHFSEISSTFGSFRRSSSSSAPSHAPSR